MEKESRWKRVAGGKSRGERFKGERQPTTATRAFHCSRRAERAARTMPKCHATRAQPTPRLRGEQSQSAPALSHIPRGRAALTFHLREGSNVTRRRAEEARKRHDPDASSGSSGHRNESRPWQCGPFWPQQRFTPRALAGLETARILVLAAKVNVHRKRVIL